MDKLGIINMALMNCGLPLAASLADCDWNAAYIFDQCLEKLLRSHAWGFALAYATLDEDETPPPFGHRHAYILPDDCAYVIDVRPGHDLRSPAGEFERVQNRIHTNNAPCNLRYVSRATPISLWPPDFRKALASLIASEIAGLSAEKMSLRADLLALHQKELAEAMAADARECRSRMPLENQFQQARDGRG